MTLSVDLQSGSVRGRRRGRVDPRDSPFARVRGWALPEKRWNSSYRPKPVSLFRSSGGRGHADLGAGALSRLTFPSPACEEGSASAGPAKYPEDLVKLEADGYGHGVHLLPLTVTPLQVETATGGVWGVQDHRDGPVGRRGRLDASRPTVRRPSGSAEGAGGFKAAALNAPIGKLTAAPSALAAAVDGESPRRLTCPAPRQAPWPA